MKTLLVLCEVKYWHDFREGLAKVGVSFLGFDKKKPNRFEIDQLVAKADFVVMRNRNVAHHSVQPLSSNFLKLFQTNLLKAPTKIRKAKEKLKIELYKSKII